MTPQQQALIQKAARSIQSAIVQNETGFPDFAASRAYKKHPENSASLDRR